MGRFTIVTRPDCFDCQIVSNFGEITSASVDHFIFVGRVIGVALFHGILLDIHLTLPVFKVGCTTGCYPLLHSTILMSIIFAMAYMKNVISLQHCFYQQFLLGEPVTLADLQHIDPVLHTSLIWIEQNDPTSLALTFEAERLVNGALQTFELMPGGAYVSVTEHNKSQYIEAYLEFRYKHGQVFKESNAILPHFSRSILKQLHQLQAMASGFTEYVSLASLSAFTALQLELFICGLSRINLEDWKENTTYENGYSTESQQIKWFWRIIEDFTDEMKV